MLTVTVNVKRLVDKGTRTIKAVGLFFGIFLAARVLEIIIDLILSVSFGRTLSTLPATNRILLLWNFYTIAIVIYARHDSKFTESLLREVFPLAPISSLTRFFCLTLTISILFFLLVAFNASFGPFPIANVLEVVLFGFALFAPVFIVREWQNKRTARKGKTKGQPESGSDRLHGKTKEGAKKDSQEAGVKGQKWTARKREQDNQPKGQP